MKVRNLVGAVSGLTGQCSLVVDGVVDDSLVGQQIIIRDNHQLIATDAVQVRC